MDSFELNKIIGAVLGTLLFVMGVGFVAEAVYEPIEGNGPGYELPEPEGTVTADNGQTEQPKIDLGTLLASANPADGAGAAKKCQSCHNFKEGGPNGQGPNLFGVVGRPVASHEGFSYSDGMKQHAADIGNWSYEELNKFITAPKDVVPGTKMNFGGVKDDKERANILAFLSTLSANPVPFPPPAPAGGEATTPAPEGGTDATAPVQPAPAETPATTPTEQPAPEPSATLTPAPAPTGSVTVTPETPVAASTTTTTTAQ